MILYIIQAKSDNILKIGICKDFRKRLTGLQNGNPYKIRLFAQFELSDVEAGKLEKELHYTFRHSRMCGEWFKLFPAQMRWLKKVGTGGMK